MDHGLWTKKNEHTITYLLLSFCNTACCIFSLADAPG